MVEFEYLPWQVMSARLLLAVGLGALVGQERERREQPAGLRTHLLVSVGSCMFTLASVSLAGDQFAPGRVAAGIITGIGFLGAGTIMRYGHSVRGLTTAASIWAIAAVGMASGMGWWELGLAGTGLLYFSLTCLKIAEQKLFPERHQLCLQVEMQREKLSLSKLQAEVAAAGYELSANQLSVDDARGTSSATIEVENVSSSEAADIMDRISTLPGVISVKKAV